MKLLDLQPNAYRYYKRNVKGNENISFEDARKKLTRNVELAELLQPTEDQMMQGVEMYAYGNLLIKVELNKIVWLKNLYGKNKRGVWQHSLEKYNELNKKLGIEDDCNIESKVS